VTAGKATIILPSKTAGEVKYPAQKSIEDVFLGKQIARQKTKYIRFYRLRTVSLTVNNNVK
jgi:hypothetical protein